MALLAKIPIYLMRYLQLCIDNPQKALIYLLGGIFIVCFAYLGAWFRFDYPYWKMKRDLKIKYRRGV